MPYASRYNGAMSKKPKTPVALKMDPDLLDEIKQYQRGQTVPPTQIGIIEAAVREFLERHRGESKRSARR
jgi:uncharacterized protein (DUF4415 family)